MPGYLLVLLTGLWLYGCSSESPLTPSPTTEPRAQLDESDLGLSSSASTQRATLSGRVLDAATGEGVPHARVELHGAGAVEATGHGTFVLPVPVTGSLMHPVVVAADGFWTRYSALSTTSVSTTGELAITLFPDREPFDLVFFDHVFRDMGERGTRPWSVEPLFEIWTNVFDCVDMRDNGVCDELEATAQPVPGQFLQMARDVIASDVVRYTGGALQGFLVTERAHPLGQRIPHALQSEIGKITIAMVQFPHTTSWARTWSFTRGDKSRAHVQLNKKHKDLRGVYSHELAHALGFRHPIGAENVPLPSIMRRGHGPEPTRHDLLHGRLMYSRPPNSTSPDRDPDGFVINALRASGIAPGPEIETVDP